MENNIETYKSSISEYKPPDVRLEKCIFKKYSPLENDQIISNKVCTFIIVTQGKGTISFHDKRTKLTNEVTAVVPYGYSVQIKSDHIEPLAVALLCTEGESIKALASRILEKENGIVMNISKEFNVYEATMDITRQYSNPAFSDYAILYKFYEFIYGLELIYSDKKAHSKSNYMSRAEEYIKNNYNKNITVESVAAILGIERSYLSRLFKAYKNKSTQNYIIDYRMDQAKRLFEKGEMNVSQVSTAVGYANIYCFSRIFKSRIGMSPKEYMDRYKSINI